MSTTLNALLTKLRWQKNELNGQMTRAEEGQHALAQELTWIEQKINQSHGNSKMINPELEINKLQFIMQQQQSKDELISQIKNQQAQKDNLQNKLQRIKTEIKMLEKYFLKEQQQQLKKQHKEAEHALEEWVLQQRELA